MKEDLKLSESGGALTAKICCEIDHHTAKRMRERIDRALFEKKPQRLILDFSEVGFMDSSGLGLIIGRAECASAIGAVVELSGLSGNIERVLRVCGIEKMKNLTVKK
jgi:stage II sporulation protein AA (anti-sigma F factor antagonist)